MGAESQTLWVLQKDGRTMTCILMNTAGGDELRILVDSEEYINERHTVHEGAIARASTLHRALEARGWTATT